MLKNGTPLMELNLYYRSYSAMYATHTTTNKCNNKKKKKEQTVKAVRKCHKVFVSQSICVNKAIDYKDAQSSNKLYKGLQKMYPGAKAK